MKKEKVLNKIFIFAFILFFIGTNIIYARTTSKLHFCEYPGTMRVLKTIGIFVIICKTAVPLILIGTSIFEFAKVTINGKEEELKGGVMKIIKRCIAGVVIFVIPTIVNYAFTALVEVTDSKEYTACSTCILDISACKIPEEDPDLEMPDDASD